MFPKPRCFWTIDAPAGHPPRIGSFGGDLEPRLLALRIRCWWASPGPSFVAGGSGRLDGLVSSRRRNIEQSPQYGPHLLTVRKPRRRDHARLGRRSDANARRGWRNRVPAETGFCFGRCYAALSLSARPKMPQPQLSRLFRHARGHAVEDTASLTGRKFVAEKY